MKRTVRVLAVVAVVSTVLGGLGASIRPAAADGDSWPVAEASSMRRARVPSVGIELEYPSHWIRMALTVAEAKTTRRRLAKTNPRLAKIIGETDVTESTEGTKFRAIDLEAQLRDGQGGVVAVQVLHSPLPPIEIFRDSYVGGIEQSGAHVFAVAETTVSHRNALRSDARMTLNDSDGTPVTLRLSQLLIEHGFTTVMVSVAVPDDEHADATIDAILSSVHRI
jgi:hypothetical protein